ncbi:hypothetical protein [Minwuia sp.]|uniref:hypothetical protein n=1 Tax=Minwuia sp. TaxID=2493630 RepID=UPI003A8F4431
MTSNPKSHDSKHPIRWLLVEFGVSAILAISLVVYWFIVQDADFEDFCEIVYDGSGWVPMSDQYAPDLYCKPRWNFTIFAAVYYFLIVFVPLTLTRRLIQFGYWQVRRHS